MEKSTIEIIKLTAADGMILTNGDAYGKEVFLGKDDDVSNWREVDEQEHKEMLDRILEESEEM